MNSNIRQTRVTANIPATYYLRGIQGEGHIIDMSVGGIGMEVKQLFVLDDLIRIKFRLPSGNNEEIDFWGIVKNVNGSILGIKYEEISNDAVESINRYMSNQLLTLGKPAKENF